MDLICLAAGAGTRMGRLGGYLQKCMYPVGLRPFLEHALAQVLASGAVVAWQADLFPTAAMVEAVARHPAPNVVTLGPGHEDESDRLRATVEGNRVKRVWDGEGALFDVGLWKLAPAVLGRMTEVRAEKGEYRMLPNLQRSLDDGAEVGYVVADAWIHLGGTLPTPEANVRDVVRRVWAASDALEAARAADAVSSRGVRAQPQGEGSARGDSAKPNPRRSRREAHGGTRRSRTPGVTRRGTHMLIARTPLRIPLGGGLTDLKPYAERFGGTTISSTIGQAAHVTLLPSLDGRFEVVAEGRVETAENLATCATTWCARRCARSTPRTRRCGWRCGSTWRGGAAWGPPARSP
jgi:hypothetical protein